MKKDEKVSLVLFTIISGLSILLTLFIVWIDWNGRNNEKRIVIDKSDHILRAYEGLGVVYEFEITAGSPQAQTSTGTFEVLNKIENVESYHGYIFPLWLGVYEVGEYENGIHSVVGSNPWEDDIGKDNTTSGSIILREKDMEKLYEWAEVGVVVVIDL